MDTLLILYPSAFTAACFGGRYCMCAFLDREEMSQQQLRFCVYQDCLCQRLDHERNDRQAAAIVDVEIERVCS
jgi:hypothetical protein